MSPRYAYPHYSNHWASRLLINQVMFAFVDFTIHLSQRLLYNADMYLIVQCVCVYVTFDRKILQNFLNM